MMSASGSRGGQSLLTIPEDCACPISRTLMEDPVLCADGHSYERVHIERWLAMGRLTSPKTNLPLPNTTLIPNVTLRNVIHSLRDPMPDAILEAAGEDEEEQLRGVASRSPSAQEPGQGRENQRAVSHALGSGCHGCWRWCLPPWRLGASLTSPAPRESAVVRALAHSSPAAQEEAAGVGQERQLSGVASPGPLAQETGRGSEDRRALSRAAGALAQGSPAARQGSAAAADQERQLRGAAPPGRPAGREPGQGGETPRAIREAVEALARGSPEEQQVEAASKLWRLAFDSDENKRAICRAEGALEALVAAMANDGSPGAQCHASGALWLLACLPESRPSIRRAGAEGPAERLARDGAAGARWRAAAGGWGTALNARALLQLLQAP